MFARNLMVNPLKSLKSAGLHIKMDGIYSWLLILPGLTNKHLFFQLIFQWTDNHGDINNTVNMTTLPRHSDCSFFSSSVCSISSASFFCSSPMNHIRITRSYNPIQQRKRRTRVCSPKRHGFYGGQFIYNTCTCVYVYIYIDIVYVLCFYIYIHTHCTSMYLYVCMYVCMYICIYIYTVVI